MGWLAYIFQVHGPLTPTNVPDLCNKQSFT